jgi:hypothetical protein
MQVTTPWLSTTQTHHFMGRLGGIVFSVLFLGAGVFCFQQTAIRPISAWLHARNWERASATIESSNLERGSGGDDGGVYSIGVKYSYDHHGQTLHGDRYGFDDSKTNIAVEWMEEEVKRLAPGTTMDCWVNPKDSQEAVLIRSFPPFAIMGLFFPLPFLLVGTLGTVGSLFGPRLVERLRKSQLDMLHQMKTTGRLAWPFESDPEAAMVAGATRLIFARTERATVTAAVVALGLFCNGIVAVFVLVAIFEALGGSTVVAVCLGLFLIPFVTIGIGMVWLAWKSLKNLRRPDWVAVINPVPGWSPVNCRISWAGRSVFREFSQDINRLRLVAMVAPWDSDSRRPQRPPRAYLRESSRRPTPIPPGGIPTDEHELTSVEIPLPGLCQGSFLSVPAMPEIQSPPSKEWGRWWALEIEHRDGRFETFELATESSPKSRQNG